MAGNGLVAGDFFTAGEDLVAAAGERVLRRVTRFSADDGVFDTDGRLELRGIVTTSAIQHLCVRIEDLYYHCIDISLAQI